MASSSRNNTAAGIDLGGTHVRVGIVGADGVVLAQRRQNSPGSVDELFRCIEVALGECCEESGEQPRAVGMCCPGIFDRERKMVTRAFNLPWIEGEELTARLEEQLQLPVCLEPDGVAAAWGEHQVLVPRPERFGWLGLGTGVGGGVILHGETLRHTNHSAGHLGGLMVDGQTLEASVSGPALQSEANLRAAPTRLASALQSLVHLHRLDTIALGGGALEGFPELFDQTKAELSKLYTILPQRVRLLRSSLGQSSGLVGAALLALG